MLRHAEAASAAGQAELAARYQRKMPAKVVTKRQLLDATALASRLHEPHRSLDFREVVLARVATLDARDRPVRAQARLANAELARHPRGRNGSWARRLDELKVASFELQALASSDASNELRSTPWRGLARVLRLQRASDADVELALAQAAELDASAEDPSTQGVSPSGHAR